MALFSSLMLYPAGFTAVGNRNHLGLTGAENVFIRGSREAAELPGRPENLEGLGALQLGIWPQIALQNNSSGVEAFDWLRLGHMPMLWLQSRLWDSASRDVQLLFGGGGNGGQGLLPKMGNSQT